MCIRDRRCYMTEEIKKYLKFAKDISKKAGKDHLEEHEDEIENIDSFYEGLQLSLIHI